MGMDVRVTINRATNPASVPVLDDSQPPLGIVVKQHSLVYEDPGHRIAFGRAEPPSRHRLCDGEIDSSFWIRSPRFSS
jgi:hypothetical protein